MAKRAVNVSDYRALAKARLPHFLFEYIDAGSNDELTLRRNVEDLQSIVLRQRVLRNVSSIDLSSELFGSRWAMPVGLGPVGLAGFFARRGETQAARAAAAAGVPFTLSTVGGCSLEEVARASVPFWFQLYFVKDRAFVADMIARAKQLGCGALILTVDLPVPGSRYRDARATTRGIRRGIELLQRPSWLWNVGIRGRPLTLGNLETVVARRAPLSDFQSWVGNNFDSSVSWKDVEWVRSQWDGPLVIKGVLDPEDAQEALNANVDAIVVSNHGGRQLDGALSTALALPRISACVGGRVPILVDGGVRSGVDVIRMLALGANFVLLGRAWAYALAARGGTGVSHALTLISNEIRVAMALVGCTNIAQIGPDILELPRLSGNVLKQTAVLNK